jgi:hypothetical protein
MIAPPSATSNLPLPRWAYVPGETEEANAHYETLAQITGLVPPRFGGYVPARHPALRYAIMLNDRGYFWESQEILETVWAAAPQGGRERILLRACILIANANLRLRMQKLNAAARLLGQALGELKALAALRRRGGFPMAFRPHAWRPCWRPNWSGRSSPRPIGSLSGPSAGHETKCMFLRFRLDALQNMHYCAYGRTKRAKPNNSVRVPNGRRRSRSSRRRKIHRFPDRSAKCRFRLEVAGDVATRSRDVDENAGCSRAISQLNLRSASISTYRAVQRLRFNI